MLFEIIDQKQQCKNIFLEDKIVSEPNYNDLTKTWTYHPSLKDYDIEYGILYSSGKTLEECCPDDLRNEWYEIKQTHMAYLKSFKDGFCELYDHCFYDLVPTSFVIKYFKIKSQITEHVIKNYDKPENYDFLFELLKLITTIKNARLNVNPNAIKSNLHQLKTRNFYTKLFAWQPYIDYNLFGTMTGRLSTKKDSFPILTMNKDYRTVVEPTNEWFVELDFNAAELRCLLSLNEQKQPANDVHDWHGAVFAKLLDQEMNRDDIKRKIFGWLYGPANVSLGIPEIERCYDKQKALKKYWNGYEVKNPFNRTIKADDFHALNALIQSTTSDVFLRRAIAVNNLLEDKKSFTMGLIHDSMVIDFAREDKTLLPELVRIFGETDLGDFKVNTRVGTNFGNMKRMR